MPKFEGQCANKVIWSTISVEVGDGDPCGNKDTGVIDMIETTQVPENGHIGIRASPPRKVEGSITQLSASTPVHAARATNRRSWKPLGSRKTMT